MFSKITDKKNNCSLRGIASIFIVIGHSVSESINTVIPGVIFVGMFFFFSGYGITISQFGGAIQAS